MPVFSWWRHEIGEPVAEFKRRQLDDAIRIGPRGFSQPSLRGTFPAKATTADKSGYLIRPPPSCPAATGASIWDSTEYAKHSNRPYGDRGYLAPRFVSYLACPPLVRAMLVAHASAMLDRLMNVFRLLGS